MPGKPGPMVSFFLNLFFFSPCICHLPFDTTKRGTKNCWQLLVTVNGPGIFCKIPSSTHHSFNAVLWEVILWSLLHLKVLICRGAGGGVFPGGVMLRCFCEGGSLVWGDKCLKDTHCNIKQFVITCSLPSHMKHFMLFVQSQLPP